MGVPQPVFWAEMQAPCILWGFIYWAIGPTWLSMPSFLFESMWRVFSCGQLTSGTQSVPV